MKVKTRLVLGGLISFAGLLVVALLALWMERAALLEERKVKTRHLVEAAHTLVTHYQAMEKAGLAAADAQAAAMQAVRGLRYEQKEYFWIHDLGTPAPRMLMHPTSPALEGKTLDSENFNRATSLQAGADGPVVATTGRKNVACLTLALSSCE